MPWVAERAPDGWKATHQHPAGGEDLGYEPLSEEDEEVCANARKRAWVRRFAKRYRKPEALCEAQNEGRDFWRRYMKSILSCVPGCMREQ